MGPAYGHPTDTPVGRSARTCRPTCGRAPPSTRPPPRSPRSPPAAPRRSPSSASSPPRSRCCRSTASPRSSADRGERLPPRTVPGPGVGLGVYSGRQPAPHAYSSPACPHRHQPQGWTAERPMLTEVGRRYPRMGRPSRREGRMSRFRRPSLRCRRPRPRSRCPARARAAPISRNPIYVAFSLLQLGIATWTNNVWLLVTLAGAVAVMALLVIPREERYMARKFGDATSTTSDVSVAGCDTFSPAFHSKPPFRNDCRARRRRRSDIGDMNALFAKGDGKDLIRRIPPLRRGDCSRLPRIRTRARHDECGRQVALEETCRPRVEGRGTRTGRAR